MLSASEKNFAQHFRLLGKRVAFTSISALRHARLDQILGVLAVQDGEIALVAEQVRVLAQNAVADGMKRAAPERRQFLRRANPPTRRIISRAALFVNVSSRNAVGGNPLLQQIRDAIGERARLARTRAGDDERRARRRGDGGELLLVQFRRVIIG